MIIELAKQIFFYKIKNSIFFTFRHKKQKKLNNSFFLSPTQLQSGFLKYDICAVCRKCSKDFSFFEIFIGAFCV